MDRGSAGTARTPARPSLRSELAPGRADNELGARGSSASYEFGFSQYPELSSTPPGHAVPSKTSESPINRGTRRTFRSIYSFSDSQSIDNYKFFFSAGSK